MLNKSVAKYSYELDENGTRLDVFEITKSDTLKKEITVADFRDFLNELVDAGFGGFSLEADTQDGASYSVCNQVLAFMKSKVIEIF